MSQSFTDTAPASFTNLLVARVAFLTQPLHQRMGTWKALPSATGAVLAMSQCSLGDAAFLPQALRHGGLEIHRIRVQPEKQAEPTPGAVRIGEIRWPAASLGGVPMVAPPPESPLDPDSAAPQALSILIHATIPASRLRSSRFLTKLQGWVAEVEERLACRWWHGIGSQDGNHGKSSTLNLHLATRPDEPLKPYDFEQRVMPVLNQACRFARQDGLLVRFDNPSTNFFVYCASQHKLVLRGQPCAEGHQHPA